MERTIEWITTTVLAALEGGEAIEATALTFLLRRFRDTDRGDLRDALEPALAEGLKRQAAAETIAERLRVAIQTGVYPPGTRLPERPLAAELGVSHIPVREALARLAEEGLVEREPRRGARVAALTARQLEEISSLRIVLEQFVARRVQQVWTPAIERQLRTLAKDMLLAADRVPGLRYDGSTVYPPEPALWG